MKSAKLAIFLSTLFAAGAMAQSPAPSETTNSEVSIAGGTAINAELDTSIDSKKAKSGEPVMAHTTEAMKAADNREIMPKGTKLMGHVTQAESRSNGGTETKVAVQFDKAKLKDGQEVPLANFTIQALAAPSSAPSSIANDNDRMTAPSNTPGSNNPSMSGSRGHHAECAVVSERRTQWRRWRAAECCRTAAFRGARSLWPAGCAPRNGRSWQR